MKNYVSSRNRFESPSSTLAFVVAILALNISRTGKFYSLASVYSRLHTISIETQDFHLMYRRKKSITLLNTLMAQQSARKRGRKEESGASGAEVQWTAKRLRCLKLNLISSYVEFLFLVFYNPVRSRSSKRQENQYVQLSDLRTNPLSVCYEKTFVGWYLRIIHPSSENIEI